MILKSIHKHYQDFKIREKDFIFFNDIFERIELDYYFIDKLKHLSNILEYFLYFKESLDNTLKVEEECIDSYTFKEIDKLVTNCNEYRKSYKSLKTDIRRKFILKPIGFELSLKLNSFFYFFNIKIPLSIQKILINEKSENYNKIKKQFDENTHFQIIVEINKIFEIKYFPYKLAESLGYKHSDLVGGDLHNLFPQQLKENHKKVILKNFLRKTNTHQLFSIKKIYLIFNHLHK